MNLKATMDELIKRKESLTKCMEIMTSSTVSERDVKFLSDNYKLLGNASHTYATELLFSLFKVTNMDGSLSEADSDLLLEAFNCNFFYSYFEELESDVIFMNISEDIYSEMYPYSVCIDDEIDVDSDLTLRLVRK